MIDTVPDLLRTEPVIMKLPSSDCPMLSLGSSENDDLGVHLLIMQHRSLDRKTSVTIPLPFAPSPSRYFPFWHVRLGL
ncbi:MAG: hypothetical protein ACRDWH_06765 [Acidimicrobiia bacterium]